MGIRAKQDVRVSWIRSRSMPRDGRYDVVGNDGCSAGGAIDYDSPLNRQTIVAWPDGIAAGGFGNGPFGHGPFGRATGEVLGFGHGAFGHGAFGHAGVRLMAEDVRDRRDGRHLLAVLAHDGAGNAQTPAAATADVVVAGEPRPPKTLRPVELSAGRLSLTFALSADDGQ